jgi:phosphatidylserine/phosphatidylglycerophosphate/cardiolipin synthase-like enzyme
MFARSLIVAATLAVASTALALPASGVTPINNREYAPAVQQLLQKARKSIWLMLYQTRYYEEYPDTITNHYVNDLIAAKQRGVDVKVLVDTGDWNPSQKNEYNLDYVDRLTTAGIEIWEDAPEDVSHQKVILVDEEITVISSLNWSYYSLANNNEVGAIIYSPEVNDYFRAYFREHQHAGKPRANALPADATTTGSAPSGSSLSHGDLQQYRKLPVADVEPVPNRLFYPVLHEAFLAAKSIDVVQRSMELSDGRRRSDRDPLPGEPPSLVNVLVNDLITAHKRGAKVRVILDANENFDNARNEETAALLRRHGVPVFSDDMQIQTHAKLVVIDDDKVVLGSTNWTQAAVEFGNEASVLVTSPELNKVYKGYVENLLLSARPFVAEPKSIWDAPTSAPKTTERQD